MNAESSLSHPAHVRRALAPVLVESTGWRAKGTARLPPRTGWYAELANATFSLLLTNLTMETTSLTVMSMKSYGPGRADSKLQVQIVVTRKREGGRQVRAKARWVASQENFTIDGHHETPTSVHFKHKLPLPGGLAAAGSDTIRANFRLVSGTVFNIKGLAFCNV